MAASTDLDKGRVIVKILRTCAEHLRKNLIHVFLVHDHKGEMFRDLLSRSLVLRMEQSRTAAFQREVAKALTQLDFFGG